MNIDSFWTSIHDRLHIISRQQIGHDINQSFNSLRSTITSAFNQYARVLSIKELGGKLLSLEGNFDYYDMKLGSAVTKGSNGPN
jgi:hypothetical protein